MQINISGHHVDVTPALREYVTNKLQKVQKRFAHITNVHVTLTVGKKYQQKVEAKVNLSGGELFADSEDENMYAAIDALIDKLDRQVVKHKEKLNHHGDGEI